MIVVPEDLQVTSSNVALEFFAATLGQVNPENTSPTRILSAFMAISSFGNIMVMTFVAARGMYYVTDTSGLLNRECCANFDPVKQEISKEGILPWAKFFGQSKNLSFGRFLLRIQKNDSSFANRHLGWLLKQRWLRPADHNQETPFGALLLHWFFTMVMIVVTISLTPADAYSFLVNMYSYTIVCVFGLLLSIGMLKLRFSRTQQWRKKSSANPFFSITAAVVFFTASAYPFAADWVPPTGKLATKGPVPWYTTPTVAFSVLGFGVLWYLVFNLYAARRAKNEGLEFRVEKVPEFDREGGSDGLPVQVHETVYMAWAAKEARNETMRVESRSSHESF
jgi:Amino acid permease